MKRTPNYKFFVLTSPYFSCENICIYINIFAILSHYKMFLRTYLQYSWNLIINYYYFINSIRYTDISRHHFCILCSVIVIKQCTSHPRANDRLIYSAYRSIIANWRFLEITIDACCTNDNLDYEYDEYVSNSDVLNKWCY